jgi:hypothetical protein
LTSTPRLGSTVARALGGPRPVRVEGVRDGSPHAVAGALVDAIREEWIVEDAWWTERPLRRRYLELVLADGRDLTVFHDITTGRWFSQRA